MTNNNEARVGRWNEAESSEFEVLAREYLVLRDRITGKFDDVTMQEIQEYAKAYAMVVGYEAIMATLRSCNPSVEMRPNPYGMGAFLQMLESIPGNTDPEIAFVYLMQTSTELVKVGRSKNPRERMRTLGMSGGFKAVDVSVFGPFLRKDASKMEVMLLRRFDGNRVTGEYVDAPYTKVRQEAVKISQKFTVIEGVP